MLFLHQGKVVILSTPKTGTTSLERALRPYAGILMSAPPSLKHMRYQSFLKNVHTLIEQHFKLSRADYEVVTVMREPVSWLESWYRYRTRPNAPPLNSTAHLTFEQFILDYLKPECPSHAAVGNQLGMITNGNRIGVDRVFPFSDFSGFLEYLSERLGKEITVPKVNQSPERNVSLSDRTFERLHENLSGPIQFYSHVRPDGTLIKEHHEIIAKWYNK